MPTVTADATRLTPRQTQAANLLLEYLANNVESDWQAGMREYLGDAELGPAMASVERAVGEGDALGVFPGSTQVATKGAGLDPNDAPIAIAALKDAGRLVQCGRGRGKCLIVISDEPLGGASRGRPRSAPADGRRARSAPTDGRRAVPARRSPRSSATPRSTGPRPSADPLGGLFASLGAEVGQRLSNMENAIRELQRDLERSGRS